jgi:hypothetical protein
MTDKFLSEWFRYTTIIPALVVGALVAPALHSDVSPAFARHPVPAPVICALSQEHGELPDEHEPEQTMPVPQCTTVITGVPAPPNAAAYWKYKSLTELE